MAAGPHPLSHDAFLAVVRDTPLVSIDLVVPDAQGRLLMGQRINEPARDEAIASGQVHPNNFPYFPAG